MITGRSRPLALATGRAADRPRVVTFATHGPAVLALVIATTTMLWATDLLWRRLDGLASPAYDLAFFQQVLWNLGARGSWTSSFHEGSFLGIHFSPLLVVPAAVQRLVGADAHVLSLIHGIAVGGLVLASFLFLRAALRPSRLAGAVATALAVAIAIWPATQWVIRADFRPELAGVAVVLLAGWAGLTGRTATMWALAALAMLAREDVAYAVLVIGLVVAIRGTRPMRVHGRALAAIAGAVGAAVFLLAMPGLRDGAVSETARYYAWLGAGQDPIGAASLLFDRVVGTVQRPDPWLMVAGMVIGLAGLPLLRPRWLLPVVPPLAALLLSDHDPQAAIILQYPLVLVVPMLVAAAMGGRRALAIASRQARTRRPAHRARAAIGGSMVAVIVGCGLAVAIVQGPLPPFADAVPSSLRRAPAIEELRAVAAVVPDDAPLVADEGLLAALAARAEIRRLAAPGLPPPDAYVIIDRAAWSPSAAIVARRDRLLPRIEASGRPVLADDGRFVVWGPLTGGDPP